MPTPMNSIARMQTAMIQCSVSLERVEAMECSSLGGPRGGSRVVLLLGRAAVVGDPVGR